MGLLDTVALRIDLMDQPLEFHLPGKFTGDLLVSIVQPLPNAERGVATGTYRNRWRTGEAVAAMAAQLTPADLAAIRALVAALTPLADLTDATALFDFGHEPPTPGAGVGGSLVAVLNSAGLVVAYALEPDRDRPARGVARDVSFEDCSHGVTSCAARRSVAQSGQSGSGSIGKAIVLKLN
ncbi:MAG: hypothetical protein JWM57_3895 [Phycisphaerales bacterium]|nr:hypothetical protein [Phycisphaerales bacterium]